MTSIHFQDNALALKNLYVLCLLISGQRLSCNKISKIYVLKICSKMILKEKGSKTMKICIKKNVQLKFADFENRFITQERRFDTEIQ